MKPVGLIDPRTGREPYAGGAAAAGQPGRRSLQPGRLPDADQVGRSGARAADDSRARAGGVRPLRHGAPQHLRQRPDGAAPKRGRCARGRRCSSPGRCRASKATSSRRRRACWPASTPRRWRKASRCRRRRGRRRSARWRTTCRTPTRRTTSRRTSRSASCRRSSRRRVARSCATSRSPSARSRIWRTWMAVRSSSLPDRSGSRPMTEHLKAFLQYLALNRNASAHTVRAYDSDLSQFLAHAAAGAGVKVRDLAPDAARSAGAARLSRRSPQAGPVARDRGAQARRGAHVPALPAPRRADRRRSGRAGRRRRSATSACRRICRKTRCRR